jgi:hypothetical protein
MAHLWFRDADEVWAVKPLGDCAMDISVYPPRALDAQFRLGHDTRAAVVSAPTGDAARWVLLIAGDIEIRVSGFPTVAGLRVLQDRDEIGVQPTGTLFFSAETLAHVEEFTAGERAIFCPRCRQPVESGQLAVCCPHCSIWYHQTAELPCWTYSPTCGVCPQATALDAGYQWVPEP